MSLRRLQCDVKEVPPRFPLRQRHNAAGKCRRLRNARSDFAGASHSRLIPGWSECREAENKTKEARGEKSTSSPACESSPTFPSLTSCRFLLIHPDFLFKNRLSFHRSSALSFPRQIIGCAKKKKSITSVQFITLRGIDEPVGMDLLFSLIAHGCTFQ